jgi:lysophospholipase L1-like esterase
MNKKAAVIVFFVSILTACGGGGGGGTASAATNTSQQTSPKHVTILMRGDSTNFGFNPQDYPTPPSQTPNNPAVLMQKDMDAAFGAGRVTVINAARSGSTLSNDINGWGDWPSLQTMLAQYKPNLVLTNSELNDRNTLDDAQYKANLIQWIQIVQASGARPILQEPNPTCPNILTTRNDQAFVRDMNDVGQQMSVTVAWNWYSWFSTQDWWVTNLQNDCVHPTDAGYESKEQNYFKTLQPIVGAMLK